jgi:hypothetical protein
MTAAQKIDRMISIEVDGAHAPDFRRLVRDARMALTVAAQSGDAARIKRSMDEADGLMEAWEVSWRHGSQPSDYARV